MIVEELAILLQKHQLSMGTAESCTGGKIAHKITSQAGSSAYFKGGIISYTNDVKENVLGVDSRLLEEKTAVCEEVAIAMVKGALNTLNVDFAISTTGVAGPGGGTHDIPVGTIWIACGNKDNIVTMKLEEDYGRDINLAIATSKALQLFLKYMEDNKDLFEEKD